MAPIRGTPGAPQAGLASVYGEVIDARTRRPIPSVAVRLAEVYRSDSRDEGAFVLDDAFSPAALTDEQGRFVIENVTPQEYIVIVGDINISYAIITTASGDAEVWDLSHNTVSDIGTLEVILD